MPLAMAVLSEVVAVGVPTMTLVLPQLLAARALGVAVILAVAAGRWRASAGATFPNELRSNVSMDGMQKDDGKEAEDGSRVLGTYQAFQ
jgi:hypothetical protein